MYKRQLFHVRHKVHEKLRPEKSILRKKSKTFFKVTSKKINEMHNNGVAGALWKFIILFSFLWIVQFAAEPEWVKDENGDLDKMKISWWSLVGAIILAVLFWIIYYKNYYDRTQEIIRAKNAQGRQM